MIENTKMSSFLSYSSANDCEYETLPSFHYTPTSPIYSFFHSDVHSSVQPSSLNSELFDLKSIQSIVVLFLVNKKSSDERIKECLQFIDTLHPKLICIYADNREHLFANVRHKIKFLQIQSFTNFDLIKNQLLLLARNTLVDEMLSSMIESVGQFIPEDVYKHILLPYLDIENDRFQDQLALVLNSKEIVSFKENATIKVQSDVFYAYKKSQTKTYFRAYHVPLLFKLFKPLVFVRDKLTHRTDNPAYSIEYLKSMPANAKLYNDVFQKYLDAKMNLKTDKKTWLQFCKKYKRHFVSRKQNHTIADIQCIN